MKSRREGGTGNRMGGSRGCVPGFSNVRHGYQQKGGPVENGGFQIMKSVYVGNLPYATTEAELKELFEQHGKVFGAKIKTDRDTGRPLGYGFVLLDDEEAPNVMQAMDGYNYEGRSLKVNESREREQTDRPQRRFDRGGNGERSFRPRRDFNNDERPPRRFEYDGNGEQPRRRFDRGGNGERSFQPRRDFNNDERPPRRFEYDGNGERPRRRFDRDGNGERSFQPRRDFNNDERPPRRFDRDGNGERSFRPRGEFNNDFDGNMTERHHNYDDKRSHNKFRRDFERDDRPQRRRFNNSRNNFRDRDNDSY